MNSFKVLAILLFCLACTLIPGKSIAKSDSGFVRHRISILPTQIILKEFSLFYEYSLTRWCAVEGSLGYQADYGKVGLLSDIKQDTDFERGIVTRGNVKLFPLPESQTLYFAPMGLFKYLSEEETWEDVDWGGGQAVVSHQMTRMVLGGYGLIGYRTPGRKIYFDFYGGLGRRYFRDRGTETYSSPSQPEYQKSLNNSTLWFDFKLGFKVGVVL